MPTQLKNKTKPILSYPLLWVFSIIIDNKVEYQLISLKEHPLLTMFFWK